MYLYLIIRNEIVFKFTGYGNRTSGLNLEFATVQPQTIYLNTCV